MVVWLYDQEKYAQQLALHPPAPIVQTTAATGTGPEASPINVAPVLASPFDTNLPEQTLVLTNKDARYTFTSRGGGLKTVELVQFPESISLRYQNTSGATSDKVASLNSHALVPTLAILGDPALVGDGNFTLTATANGVSAVKLLPNGLRLEKDFEISSNYLVNTRVRLENNSDHVLTLPAQEWVVGTATPMDVDDNGMSVGTMWYDGAGMKDVVPSWFSAGMFGGAAKTQYLMGSNNVYWAAVHNQFFALIAMPPTNEPALHIVGRPINLPWLSTSATTRTPVGIQTALVYPGLTLAAHGTADRSLTLYAGPKEYRGLARIGEAFQNKADLVMNFGFFGFFAKALLLGLNWIHDVTTLGYGWTIVLITLILRAMFWPLTAASTRSMKRMQALSPELNALKEKYKDDVQKLTQKQWELYKKNKVSPLSGCLPMMVQMPVFIGFFTMIRSAIELRGAHFLWVTDLSKPDTLWLIPGINFPFNLLPLLMVAVMVWQAHLQPPSPGMDPGQQKMMRFMPVIMLLFLYSYSSGMALYMTVSTLAGVVQTKLTKINPPTAAAVAVDTRLTPKLKKQK
jgi:YidC/Oxa1 family membrane protein insertase